MRGLTKHLHLTAAHGFRSAAPGDLGYAVCAPPPVPTAVGEAHRSAARLRIQAATAERHAVRVNDGQDYPVAPDGRVTFEVPPLPPIRWGRYMVTTLHGYMSYMGERLG
jgi:hypothetical protein